MKVQVYSKFSKNKIWKKMKSPSSMRNGRFDTPKYRVKVQKMGVLNIHPQRSPGLCKMQRPLKNIYFKFPKKIQKKPSPYLYRWQPAATRSWATKGRRPLVGERSAAAYRAPWILHSCTSPPAPFLLSLALNFFACGQIFLIGSITCPPYSDFS
jgi:hypothetical protein